VRDVSDQPLRLLSPRALDAHKGDFGRVLVVAGSREMPGAAALCGLAALRSGAGLATVATVRSALPIVAGHSPCYTLCGLEEDADGRALAENAARLLERGLRADAWALGPGLGLTPDVEQLVCELYRRVTAPMVVDADALNALAAHPEVLGAPGGPRIFTPHAGEFARVTGETLAADLPTRAAQAARFVRRCEADLGRCVGAQPIVVLVKGRFTLIVEAERYAINRTGNPGMATGGVGDCLTGMLAALMGQRFSPWEAGRLAAHVHGAAGDAAAAELGQTALIAADLLAQLPAAWQAMPPPAST
jgi:NAD(P)H-hydrate epimerase